MARKRSDDDDDHDDRPRSRRRYDDDDDDDDDDRPRRRSSAKKSGGTSAVTILLILGGVFLVIVLICGGVGLYFYTTVARAVVVKQQQVAVKQQQMATQAEQQAKTEDNTDQARAKKIVDQWVSNVTKSQFSEAYALTSPNYRSKVTQAEFTAIMKPLSGEFSTIAPSVILEEPFAAKTGTSFGFKLFWTGTQDVNFQVKNDNGNWQIDQIATKLSWFGEVKQKQK